MEEFDIRDVSIEDATWKVQATGESAKGPWCLWVPYADARVYGERLDAWAGELGWSDSYRIIDAAGTPAVECRLVIHKESWEVVRHGWAEFGEREKVKGAESDAFKRAAAKCGIGRNLYRFPKLYTGGEKKSDGKIYPPREVDGMPTEKWLMNQVKETGVVTTASR